jgi:hypothetical protein
MQPMLVGKIACRRYCAAASRISNPVLLGCGPLLGGDLGVELHDVSRRVRKLRRKAYRQLPVATPNRVADLDHRMSYGKIAAMLGQSQLGVDPAGAALALWRACVDRGLRAWCYEFGFPESFTQSVTIVEIDGELQVHDAYFNLSYPLSFYDVLESLRNGNAVTGKRVARDRKIYIMDPAGEPETTVRWLEANADRELKPTDGLRRFELAWSPEAFTAACSAIDLVSHALAARGHPGDLQFLMLYPIAVFDGEQHWPDSGPLPLVGSRDLQSPVAALRVAARDLEAERAKGVEKTARIERIDAELIQANSLAAQLAAARDEADRTLAAEREAWLQQKVALQAGRSALEAELAKTRSQLSGAVDLRAQRDSQIAQLRAEIEDASRQFELQKTKLVVLEGERQEQDAARLRLEIENRDFQLRLEASSRQNETLRRHAALVEGRVDLAEQQMIEMTNWAAPLLDELEQLRRENRSLAAERDAVSRQRAMLAAQIAASPGARLRALWRRFAGKLELPFRAGRVRD